MSQQVGGRVIPSQELHMTLLHVGIPGQLFDELRRENPELGQGVFEAGLSDFVQSVSRLMPIVTEVHVTDVAAFGPKNDVIVLRTVADKQLHDAHEACLRQLKAFLMQCLHRDPVPYMRRSNNLRHSLEFSPHVALFRKSDSKPLSTVVPQETLRFERVQLCTDLKNHI